MVAALYMLLVDKSTNSRAFLRKMIFGEKTRYACPTKKILNSAVIGIRSSEIMRTAV